MPARGFNCRWCLCGCLYSVGDGSLACTARLSHHQSNAEALGMSCLSLERMTGSTPLTGRCASSCLFPHMPRLANASLLDIHICPPLRTDTLHHQWPQHTPQERGNQTELVCRKTRQTLVCVVANQTQVTISVELPAPTAGHGGRDTPAVVTSTAWRAVSPSPSRHGRRHRRWHWLQRAQCRQSAHGVARRHAERVRVSVRPTAGRPPDRHRQRCSLVHPCHRHWRSADRRYPTGQRPGEGRPPARPK